MKSKLSILLMTLFTLFIVIGCSTNDAEDNEQTTETKQQNETAEQERENPFPVTLEINGEKITIEKKPEKIIPLSLEVAEAVLELVEPSRVVAVTRGVDSELLSTKSHISKEIPNRIAAASNIDPEEIIAFETDLLLITKMFGQEEDAADILSQLDTPIITFDSIVKVDQFIKMLEVVGKAVGEQEKAENLAQQMRDDIEAIQQSILEGSKPSVLVLSEIGGDLGPFMLGPTNISYDLIQLAGATPAVDKINLQRSTPASIEQIIKTEPDYIMLLDFFGKGEQGFQQLMEDPGWNTLTAVNEGRVKMIEAKYLLNPNVENVKGLKILTEWIHQIEQ